MKEQIASPINHCFLMTNLISKKLEYSTTVDPFESSIEFNNVTFHYDESKNVLKYFNLRIPAGKITALVGPTGAGKSTVFKLLQGVHKPESGEIFIEGVPIQEYRPSE